MNAVVGVGWCKSVPCPTCRSVPYPKFPAPMPMGGVNVTMLPFICGIEFEDYRLPEYVKQYEDLIKFCLQHQLKRNASFLGKVCYLTIWERDIAAGEFLGQDCVQTKAGLSVNFPGGLGKKWRCPKFLEYKGIQWINSGGVYLMSNSPESTNLWKCKIKEKIVSKNGNIEHMREFLPNAAKNCWNGMMEPDKVYRITERTPLDNLPLKKQTKVQFFRITTSKVPFWCQDHYTASPLGVLPDPRITEIVSDGKILTEWREEALKQIMIPAPSQEEDTSSPAPCSCVSTEDQESPSGSVNTQEILHLNE